MAKFTIIKLCNLSPLHIGTGNEAYEVSSTDLQSDTLSAALASIRASHGKTDDLQTFMESFSLSCAFPYSGNQYFFPKPQGRIDVVVRGKEEHEYRKKLKKIKYVNFADWCSIIKGDRLEIDDNQLQKVFLTQADGQFTLPNKSQVNQRVSVSRDSMEDASPFFFEWTYFSDNCGLFCLLDAKTLEIKDEVLSLFKELGETGVGTDKSVGGGKFTVEDEEIELPNVDNPSAQMILSLYIPTEEELSQLNLQNSVYSLLKRGGYMSGSTNPDYMHLYKKQVYMFASASVFYTRTPINGKIVDLKPEWNDANMHPVFRSGMPIVIPVNY